MKTKPSILKIHADGYFFVCIFALTTAIVSLVSSTLAWIGFILTAWCIYFFRDPDRVVPEGSEYIVSPADGVVTSVSEVALPEELDLGEHNVTKISVFLSIFDTHVNRVPADGVVKKVHYHPGKFINASLDKSSIHNERNHIVMKLKHNDKPLVFTQIAGLIARRIVCDLKKNQDVSIGQRYGIIRFGSRVDIYLPKGEVSRVSEGQYVIGGETILAKLGSREIITTVVK